MVPPLIELIGATKRFPSGSGSVHTAVRDLSMTVQPGEFVAVVGPTGCGKSTTLSLVSGLQPPSAGRVRVNGDDVKSIPDGVGYMFQTDAVMPWRSVLDNVASGPRFRWNGPARSKNSGSPKTSASCTRTSGNRCAVRSTRRARREPPMSLDIPAAAPPLPVLETEQDILARAKQASSRRKRNIWLLRLAIVVAWLGAWELTATLWIDPFFYSKPSKIWERLVSWISEGTDFGSIWYQILVTVE